ncbi:MAG: hypothetical protein ACRDL8_19435, partial [Solirubrobacteraceae bacterium]
MRLPREWLGPRGELVPIAPVGESPSADPDLDAIVSASAFWSEDSASLQDVVQAPPVAQARPVAQAPAPVQTPETPRTRRLTLPRLRNRPHAIRWAILAAGVGAILV